MDNFFANFLDDYFAECDEHIINIRDILLTIESQINQLKIENSLLDKLFISFHSIKGLSGMVGLKEAEELSHEMESYLRLLREQKIRLTAAGIDALIDGTTMLEQVITAYHTQSTLPDIGSIMSQLTNAFSEKMPDEEESLSIKETVENQPVNSVAIQLTTIALKPAEQTELQLALEKGEIAWQFEFLPGQEKAERGINVNTIRERLRAIGKLIHASPKIRENGDVVFNFVVTTNVPETSFAGWDADGLTYRTYLIKEIAEKPEKLTSLHPTSPLTQTSPIINATGSTPSNVVRVDLTKLDELMRMVGELVTTRAKFADNLKNLKNKVPAAELRTLRETNLTLERQLRDLREGVMRVRLVPIGEIFTRMQFVIRDLAKESQKQISLELYGQNTEIDKFVVERMLDPMMHMVRNAVSHGLESESERINSGKSPQGKISLRAATAGEMVVIQIADDGRGVDVEAVINQAKKQDLIDSFLPNQTIDDNTILDIICSPCFSTREQVDLTSGRGVGMVVVKNTVNELGGFITLESEKGKGTTFTIQLPLTLAIADALIISVQNQTFAIPQSAVREVIQVPESAIAILENNELIPYRGQVLPLIRLATVFNLKNNNETPTNKEVKINQKFGKIELSPAKSNLKLIVVGNGVNAIAIAVDQILGQQEIVVRPLTDSLVQTIGIAGATELGDGRIVLIIDTLALTRIANSAVKIKNYPGKAG
ncbi:chemotaxis protein CheA [Aerosakkonemataceae cyanobacterium BLCC-F154]|uniref:histidine kinase n=1 Tax=Floridaenema fluviatile BLCC-F154 TaxID=3153640 RepID=A0ABV4YD11_9CYAN